MSDELKNMQEFAIENENNENSLENAYDPLEDLANHDFSSETEINLDESYEIIQMLKRDKKESKLFEAEEIIKELSDNYLDFEYKEKLEKAIENVKSYIKKYDVNSDFLKNAEEKEKTKIYAIGSFLNKNVAKIINDFGLSIQLTREEFKFIKTALKSKLSYDGNEVFNIIELNEKYLSEWEQLDKDLPKEVPSFNVDIDIKNVVMLYHFLQKHTVKGISKEYYTFADILQKIADTNKLYNAYNIIKERLNVDFNIWVGAMSEIGADVPQAPEQVQGQAYPGNVS